MKRLEAVVPDGILRQMLVLLAEDAREIHVYDLEPPAPEVKVVTKQISAPEPKPKPQPRADLPEKPAPVMVMELLQESETMMSASDLNIKGRALGYGHQTLGHAARKMSVRGDLIKEIIGGVPRYRPRKKALPKRPIKNRFVGKTAKETMLEYLREHPEGVTRRQLREMGMADGFSPETLYIQATTMTRDGHLAKITGDDVAGEDVAWNLSERVPGFIPPREKFTLGPDPLESPPATGHTLGGGEAGAS